MSHSSWKVYLIIVLSIAKSVSSVDQFPSGLLTGQVCSSRPGNIQGKKNYYRVGVRKYITNYSYCRISDGICVSQCRRISDGMSFTINVTVKIDAYPNISEVEQGTTVVLVCRVVGVPYGSELTYNWTCASGNTRDNPSEPSQAGSRRQYNNTVVVDIVKEWDNGDYQCNVSNRSDGVILGSDTHRVSVTGLFTSLYYYHLIEFI